MMAALVSVGYTLIDIYTVIFSINILQIEAHLALAIVAAEGVDTLTVVWTEVLACYTFINIHTAPLIWPQLEPSGRAEASDLPLDLFTTILAVG